MSFASKLMSFVRLVLVAGLVAALAPAQELRYPPPDKFDRATKTDEANMIQWADHVQEKCRTCQGNGKTKCTTCERFPEEAKTCFECKRTADKLVPCRVCAGLGHAPDPLEKVLCCACLGAGFHECVVCHGGGVIRVQGSGDKWLDCPGCRGPGGFKCGVCNGERTVEVASLKPSLRDANAAALKKAIATTETVLQGLGAFTPTGKNSRKEVKEINRVLTLGQALFAPIKRTPKVLEDYMGKAYGGSNFVGHEESEANAMQTIKSSAEYYLKHQKRMMELALKRAEANEKLAAENKGK